MNSCRLSLICLSCCDHTALMKLALMFTKLNLPHSELLLIDAGADDRQKLFKMAGRDSAIHYIHAPECSTPERRMARAVQIAQGEIWHLVTPDTDYAPNHFSQVLARISQAPQLILGSATQQIFLPALNTLRALSARAAHVSFVNALSFHRQHYRAENMWFNLSGDEATLGQPFTPLIDLPTSHVTSLDDITARAILPLSRQLDASTLPASAAHPVDWSLISKIALIQPDHHAPAAQLAQLAVPADNVFHFKAMHAENPAASAMLSQLSVLKIARAMQWENVLILSDDVQFVASRDASRQLNQLLHTLRHVHWDVALLGADYRQITPLVGQQNLVRVAEATAACAYLVNSSYYDPLISHYEAGLEQLHDHPDYLLEQHWCSLMPQHRWLGAYPVCAFQPGENSGRFFRPLLALQPQQLVQQETHHIRRCDRDVAQSEDFHALANLYSARQHFELADYFTALAQGHAEPWPQDRRWPKLSVVIATYNQSAVLMRTLDSVRRQRYPHLEIVVVDDCSTDNTAACLATVTDPRVRVLRPARNQGGAEAQKWGFEHSDGEYLFYINHDDLLLDRDFLLDAVITLQHDRTLAMVFANFYQWHEQQAQVQNNARWVAARKISGKHYFEQYQSAGFPNLMYLSTVFRRDLALKAEANVATGIADIHLFHRLLLVGDVAHLPRFSSAYRVHASSMTFTQSDNSLSYLEPAFMDDLTRTAEMARHHGFTRQQIEKWKVRQATLHFTGWRIHVAREKKQYGLALNILSWLQQHHPVIGEKVLSVMCGEKI